MAQENDVVRGQELSILASTWNTLLDVARDHRRGKPLRTPPVPGGPRAQVVVLVRNDTGGPLAEYSAIGVNDLVPLVSAESDPADFTRGPVLSAVLPEIATDQPAVTLEPIPEGECGRAAVLGVVPVTVEVWDAALNAGAGGIRPGDYLDCVASSPTFLKSKEGCARLLWYKPVSTGDSGPRRGVALLGADNTDYDFEAITDTGIAVVGCVITLTITLTRFRHRKPDTTRVVTKTATIPSTCVDMVTGGSISCVAGAPVLTLTTTKVRVLDCGACP